MTNLRSISVVARAPERVILRTVTSQLNRCTPPRQGPFVFAIRSQVSSLDELTGAYRRGTGLVELEREMIRAKRTR